MGPEKTSLLPHNIHRVVFFKIKCATNMLSKLHRTNKQSVCIMMKSIPANFETEFFSFYEVEVLSALRNNGRG